LTPTSIINSIDALSNITKKIPVAKQAPEVLDGAAMMRKMGQIARRTSVTVATKTKRSDIRSASSCSYFNIRL
jgi:hypothetical protein